MCIPLWIVLVLIVAAFVAGCLVLHNNAKLAAAEVTRLSGLLTQSGVKF